MDALRHRLFDRFTNVDALSEVAARRKREGRMALADAAATSMLNMIKKGVREIDDAEFIRPAGDAPEIEGGGADGK